MSRFFTAGDSSSESSSSDEEELYSDDETTQKLEDESDDDDEATDDDDSSSSASDGQGKSGVAKFLRDQVSSDESEDEDKVTVVMSAKDKRLEELEAIVRSIDNAQKINDWSSISTGKTDA